MIFGAYFVVTVFVYFWVLRWSRLLSKSEYRPQVRVLAWTLWSAGLAVVGLVLFTGFSIGQGILAFGHYRDSNFPQDFMVQGAAGWGILLTGLAGVLSPVWAAIICRRLNSR